MSNLHALWTEKYRPKDIEDYIFQDKSQKTAFLKHMIDRSIPNLMLSGIQGTGKSSLALLLLAEIGVHEMDLLKIDGSIDNSVDTIRTKVESFVTLFAEGDYKVVWVEEADRLSYAAQDALKDITETNSDTVRFIFTCNAERKIKPELKSRFQQYRFKAHSKPVVRARITEILTSEKIKFDPALVENYVDIAYPDIRKTINLIQQYSSSGTLLPCTTDSENAEFQSKLLEMIIAGDWYNMKTEIIPNLDNEHWDDFYKFIYENIGRSSTFTELNQLKQGYVTIAEYLYRHAIVADPVINATAMVVRLSEI